MSGKQNHKYDVLVVGGGIFGVSAAIELARRNHKVGLINPDTIPHHLASSTDISKAVRVEYGSDHEYFKMAEYSIEKWREWNEILEARVFHEVGFLMLCKESLTSDYHHYERDSYNHLRNEGYNPQKLSVFGLKQQFPAVNTKCYSEACFNPKGGFAESGRAVEFLARHARAIGVDIHEGQTMEKLVLDSRRCTRLVTREGSIFDFDHVCVSAGTSTPFLFPELKPFFRITGHSVFWVKPMRPKRYSPPKLSVFTADISNTGWYGFPLHPKQGVVKIGRHSKGENLNPYKDDRRVKTREIDELRVFLKDTFPDLSSAPLVYTRKCLYTDTLDGHFWIDRHPNIEGVTICTGGSGHGFKMGPIVGEMAADVVEGKNHKYSARYRWRYLSEDTVQQEEARNA